LVGNLPEREFMALRMNEREEDISTVCSKKGMCTSENGVAGAAYPGKCGVDVFSGWF
jgi:hypothetical protein